MQGPPAGDRFWPGQAGRDGGSELTADTGQVLGTPSYMPPEQAAGQIDAMARGGRLCLRALLYSALTGRPPFQAATALETMQQVLEREPVALRQLNAAIPRDLETIVLKCLEKSVPRRYATAEAWPTICGVISKVGRSCPAGGPLGTCLAVVPAEPFRSDPSGNTRILRYRGRGSKQLAGEQG